MASRLLREMFGLTEMSVEIPDGQLPKIRKAIHAAVRSGDLPDTTLSLFFPSGAKPAAVEPDEKPAKGNKAKDVSKPATAEPPKTSTGPDASQKTWDSLAGKLGAQKPAATEPKAASQFDPTGVDPDYKLPDFGGSRSAAVDTDGDDEYKSPFNWNAIDPHGTRDVGPGDEPPSLKGPGLATRAKQGLGRIFSTDPQKKLDRTMKRMDRDAQKAARPQGALSQLFRGKDVTR